jgi:hypothetical protein
MRLDKNFKMILLELQIILERTKDRKLSGKDGEDK